MIAGVATDERFVPAGGAVSVAQNGAPTYWKSDKIPDKPAHLRGVWECNKGGEMAGLLRRIQLKAWPTACGFGAALKPPALTFTICE